MPAKVILRSGVELNVEESRDELERLIVNSRPAGSPIPMDDVLVELAVDHDEFHSYRADYPKMVVRVAEIAAVVDRPRRPRI